MEEGQTPDSVEGDQHFDQKLFMLRFQRQSETINYTEGQRKGGGREKKAYIKHEHMKEFHCEAVKAGGRSMSGGETCLSVYLLD